MRNRTWVGLNMLALLSTAASAAPLEDKDRLDYPASFFAAFHPNNALEMVRRIPGFTFQPGNADLRGILYGCGEETARAGDGMQDYEWRSQSDDKVQE